MQRQPKRDIVERVHAYRNRLKEIAIEQEKDNINKREKELYINIKIIVFLNILI